MQVKVGVWEPGKADPSRFDRASTLEEFADVLGKLNPGDEIQVFFPKRVASDDASLRQVVALEMKVATETPTLYQALYNAVNDIIAIGGWLTPEQIAIIDENVLRITREHDRT